MHVPTGWAGVSQNVLSVVCERAGLCVAHRADAAAAVYISEARPLSSIQHTFRHYTSPELLTTPSLPRPSPTPTRRARVFPF